MNISTKFGSRALVLSASLLVALLLFGFFLLMDSYLPSGKASTTVDLFLALLFGGVTAFFLWNLITIGEKPEPPIYPPAPVPHDPNGPDADLHDLAKTMHRYATTPARGCRPVFYSGYDTAMLVAYQSLIGLIRDRELNRPKYDLPEPITPRRVPTCNGSDRSDPDYRLRQLAYSFANPTRRSTNRPPHFSAGWEFCAAQAIDNVHLIIDENIAARAEAKRRESYAKASLPPATGEDSDFSALLAKMKSFRGHDSPNDRAKGFDTCLDHFTPQLQGILEKRAELREAGAKRLLQAIEQPTEEETDSELLMGAFKAAKEAVSRSGSSAAAVSAGFEKLNGHDYCVGVVLTKEPKVTTPAEVKLLTFEETGSLPPDAKVVVHLRGGKFFLARRAGVTTDRALAAPWTIDAVRKYNRKFPDTDQAWPSARFELVGGAK